MIKMDKTTLQIQSVIYKNKKASLLKAMKGIETAISICRRKGMELEVSLCYGDASPNRIFSNTEVKNITKLLSNITFYYDFFGFNSGTARGHNRLGKDCHTDFMMIMNPDVVLEGICLWELLSKFHASNIGLVEARQTPLELAKLYDVNTLETEWASTACAMFRTDIFHKLNGFDSETFFMYCDDLDFSWRLRLEGYKILYNPNAIAYHAKSLSNLGEWKPTSAEIYYSAEAAILMAHKYSNQKRVEKLLKQFDSIGCEDEKRAAQEYRKRKKDGKLPVPIDENHMVSKFIGDNYSFMRFSYYK